jgi:phosphatidylglycerol:prolipoprotein diacylglycerol transferase
MNWDVFAGNLKEVVMLQRGGLAWQGGLILGTLVGVSFIRFKKLSFRPTLDLLAPYLALGQSIGRIGCFLNGCCYGREVPWGIYFPVHQAHLHPTQLYASAALFLIYCVLKAYRKRPHAPGQVLALYFILAGVQRFVIEFFRADHELMAVGLSVFQLVSLSLSATGVLLMWYFKLSRSQKV